MTNLDPTGQSNEPSLDQPSPLEPGAGSEYESTLLAAPAAPVHATGSARRRPVRWPVAIFLIALVLAVSAFVGILVTGRAPNARVLGYVPDGTLVYGEARLDFPGDQRTALASFLSKFPGFADQSAIEGKLNELMDRFVGGVTNGDQTYTRDISPWFDGELAFALGPLPDPAGLAPGNSAGIDQVRFLVLLSVKDQAGVTAWLKDAARASSVTMSDASYDGANLTLLNSQSEGQGAFAVLDGKVAVIGDVASVKAAVDTRGEGPFASQPDPKAALAATDSSHLGFAYVDVKTLMGWSQRLDQAVMPSLAPALDNEVLGLIPDWAGLALRVEGDAVVLESVAPQTAIVAATGQNRTSPIASQVPATAIMAVVADDYGSGLKSTFEAYRANPAMKSVMDQIDGAVGMLGGLDAAIGWIGDTGVVVNESDGHLEAGVIVQPTDGAAAERVLTSLRAVVALAGGQAGITLHDEPYAGTTVTTIDLGDVDRLLQGAGVTPSMLGPGVTLPTGRVEVSYAVTDQVVVLGSSPAFVEHVLDTTPATSLASNERYKALVDRVGPGTRTAFVDIAAIRAMLEGVLTNLDPSAAGVYSREVAPFLAPFDALITSGSVGNGLSSGKVIITVR